ncbi:MAG: DUF2357 domain-containing protein [Lachnospiraceae bacterium]|nr:DUF2357 domain-containing protein [Lachnospiraceae bacterium]
MATCLLTLRPFHKPSFSVRMSENDGKKRSIEQIITKSPDVCVFSDLSYEFAFSCEESIVVQDVNVYINDVYEQSVYNDGLIMFPGEISGNRRIFMDCYGFVEISLVVSDADGNEYQYTTEYLPVLVRRGELNNAVKAMVNYVYSNQELLLLNGEPKAKNLANLKESGYQNLSAQIVLAEEIAAVYESSFGYFKANSRFKIDKVSKVDQFERLQYLTPATVQYIASHPGELRKINGFSGVRIGNSVYQPEKTLSTQNERSYDIYENRVVLGFIREMIDSLDKLHEQCCALLKQIPGNENYSDEYIYSSFFMFIETKRMLENGLTRLTDLQTKFMQLWTMYSGALKIKEEITIRAPRPSSIFLSVPQYNRIFVQIHKWFRFGIYDFARENYMFSFIKISALYEGYLLAKMIAYFQSRGYLLESTKKCIYPTKRNWKYKNVNSVNTFFFKKDRYNLTLYYQPVIYDSDESSINGIGLFRNNSIPILNGEEDENRLGGHYYSPDYLIKMEDSLSTRYLILDAKFSDLACVRRYHVRNLAFKYLFSISTVQPTDLVVGLCVLYGKCRPSDQIQSAYDKQLQNQQIMPITELLPLMESIADDEHYRNLDALMRKAFSLY